MMILGIALVVLAALVIAYTITPTLFTGNKTIAVAILFALGGLACILLASRSVPGPPGPVPPSPPTPSGYVNAVTESFKGNHQQAQKLGHVYEDMSLILSHDGLIDADGQPGIDPPRYTTTQDLRNFSASMQMGIYGFPTGISTAFPEFEDCVNAEIDRLDLRKGDTLTPAKKDSAVKMWAETSQGLSAVR